MGKILWRYEMLDSQILSSMKPKEKNEIGNKEKIEKFDFVRILVVQCKIFQIVNIPSKAMQFITIDLISA